MDELSDDRLVNERIEYILGLHRQEIVRAKDETAASGMRAEGQEKAFITPYSGRSRLIKLANCV